MKKLFMILIIVGIALGISGVTYAQQSSYTICSSINTAIGCNDSHAGSNYLSGFSDTFNQTGTYTFSIFDGSWQNDGANSIYWQWSLYIYQPSNSATYPDGRLLGTTDQIYMTQDAALIANKALPSGSIDISVTAGETLSFYIKDSVASDNYGNVTMNVAVVPEPISSVLFLTGGVVLVGRKYMKKRHA